MIHYGAKLKNLRVNKSITQEAFAIKMDRSQNAVSSIERNQYPTLENIILYLNASKFYFKKWIFSDRRKTQK